MSSFLPEVVKAVLRLRVEYANRSVLFPLCEGASLGSAEDNDLVISAPGVSRHHARVESGGVGFELVDCGSKNGLRVGRVRQQRIPLQPGRSFTLGEARVVVEEISTSDAALALELPRHETSSESAAGGRTTATGDAGPAGPAAAWRWARNVETSLPGTASRPALLEGARNALGAETLIAYLPGEGDVAIVALVGEMPAQGELVDAERLAGNGWIVASPGHGVSLAARFTSQRNAPAWRNEFLDYVRVKLFDEYDVRLRAAHDPARGQLEHPEGFVVGAAAATRQMLAELTHLAQGRIDIMITGERGVGKELVARMIHASGPTARGPFVAVNCSAIAPELLEAEMFGILRGVATGVEARAGYFAAADGGTILLDEITEMPPGFQAKLLRVLQEREVQPVGSSKPRPINVRVISSTNRNVHDSVVEGRLRADLHDRLRGAEINVPALRNRREDIPHLVLAFAATEAAAAHKRLNGVSSKALERLLAYDWPGNIRELQNAIKRAVLLCPNGGTIESRHLALADQAALPPTALEHVERNAIEAALRSTEGNKAAAARILGVTRQGLYLMLKRHGLR